MFLVNLLKFFLSPKNVDQQKIRETIEYYLIMIDIKALQNVPMMRILDL